MGEPESNPAGTDRTPGASPGTPAQTPLMRALGQFFGEVWKGVKADPRGDAPGDGAGVARARRQVEEREVETEEGRVILRRTTIDEVIVPPAPPAGEDRSGGQR